MDMQHGEMGDEKAMMKMKWREHRAMRALTAVIVIGFVFWCGFEFGEIRASVGLEHGYRMMQGGWSGNVRYTGMMAYPMTSTPSTGVMGTPAPTSANSTSGK